MKKNKTTRRAVALENLEKMVASKKISPEFNRKISDLPEDSHKKAIASYWEQKKAMIETLKNRIQSY